MVRHAAHGLLGKVLTGRMAGVPLSAEGVGQAKALGEWFTGMRVAAVLSSPVQRARETAAAIAEATGLTVTVEAGLDEIDFGEWTGSTFAALEEQAAWSEWNRHRGSAACPGGETMRAAQARAVAAVLRAGQAFAGENIVMVSHQDVLKAVLAHFLGIALDDLERFSLDPASRSVVSLSDGWARVEAVNHEP
ncbi:MAG: histidine phosphatase family protein [Acetobacteraceae bacterium]|nr:histidine phosphatase family protein [Acetobacteraceae bacterium]